MNLLSIFMLAVAISLDGLVVGITYGLKKIKIDYFPLFIISAASGAMILISMSIGDLITNFLTPRWTTKIGGGILVFVGLWLFYQSLHNLLERNDKEEANIYPREIFSFKISSLGLIVNILKEPVKADLDYSGVISKKEAVFLGIALALDAFGAGLGAAIIGYQPLVTTILVIGCKFCLLAGGVYLGKHFIAKNFGNRLKLIPGLIIALLGLIKLL